jgi:hypothetical protein
MNHVLAHLVLALVAAETVHALAEMLSARAKVKRLDAYIAGRPYREIPARVDTRPKAYAVGLTVFLVLAGVFFAILSLINALGNTLLIVAAALVLITYFAEFVGFDRFHVEIEAVTRPFKNGRANA